MKVKKLSPLQREMKLQIGDKLEYSYNEHVSVGYTADFEIEDNLVVVHTGTDTIYDELDKMKREKITGADSAITTFNFRAIGIGTTLLIIRSYFRSKLEEEYKFRIIVE